MRKQTQQAIRPIRSAFLIARSRRLEGASAVVGLFDCGQRRAPAKASMPKPRKSLRKSSADRQMVRMEEREPQWEALQPGRQQQLRKQENRLGENINEGSSLQSFADWQPNHTQRPVPPLHRGLHWVWSPPAP